MEAKDADRSRITMRDHVDAVVAAIDSCGSESGVVLVGHSAGAGIAYAAVDARPDRVAGAIYVGGFPTGTGTALVDGFPVENGAVSLPAWSAFEDEDLADLDDEARADLRARAIPLPARVTRDPQQLADERRYDVPVTVICTEFSSEMLRKWIEQEMAPVRELAKICDVEYIDLPTGHWPQFTRPDDLARAILRAQPLAAAAGPDVRGPGLTAQITPRQFAEAAGVEDGHLDGSGLIAAAGALSASAARTRRHHATVTTILPRACPCSTRRRPSAVSASW